MLTSFARCPNLSILSDILLHSYIIYDSVVTFGGSDFGPVSIDMQLLNISAHDVTPVYPDNSNGKDFRFLQYENIDEKDVWFAIFAGSKNASGGSVTLTHPVNVPVQYAPAVSLDTLFKDGKRPVAPKQLKNVLRRSVTVDGMAGRLPVIFLQL